MKVGTIIVNTWYIPGTNIVINYSVIHLSDATPSPFEGETLSYKEDDWYFAKYIQKKNDSRIRNS